MKLKCNICNKIIETEEDTDYEEFTEHLVEFHFPELVEAFGE